MVCKRKFRERSIFFRERSFEGPLGRFQEVSRMRIAIVEDRADDQEDLSGLFSEEARERGWAYMIEA